MTGLAQFGGSPGSCRSWAVQARWMAAACGRDGSDRLGLRVRDEVAVAHRGVADGEFENPVEDQAPAAGGAAVEAEYELVEVALQVCLVDRALVGAQQPPLGEGRDSVHAGQ